MKERINKLCPFCHFSTYRYRTFNGLVRHVMYCHCSDSKGEMMFSMLDKAEKLGIETSRGLKFIDIKGWEEVEEFLLGYIQNFNNPSKRSSRLWKYCRSEQKRSDTSGE